MNNIFHVELTKSAQKDIVKLPKHIVNKLLIWVGVVSEFGIAEARKIKGYHDESLQGKRSQQRSIRLSASYRAIYEIKSNKLYIHYIEIQEVNKHEY